jgi:ergothioneine biosynthesis protein EgtB
MTALDRHPPVPPARLPSAPFPSSGGDDDREALRARYRRVRDLTEALAAPLRPEDQVIQSMADVSPTKWHRGHTTWFFETFLLEPSLTGYDLFDPDFRYLFNSYYEAVGPRHPRSQRGLLSRPTVEEIARYRAHVDTAMEKLIDRCDTGAWPELAALAVLGLHHEQQHQELLLMDIKHVLFNNPFDSAYVDTAVASVHGPRAMRMLEYPGGLVEIGHAHAPGHENGFAFDNESPRHKVFLEPFRIADRLVTSGEWLEFIADNGYERPELWLSDGWYAVQERGWNAPLYWRRDELGGWSAFTLGGWRELDPDEPVVHVSHYEADAFARWSGARLPTEFEWEHAIEPLATEPGLADSAPGRARLHPAPAPDGDALVQAYGDVWQWTASAYLPYPRFAPEPGAVGEYNGKFMSGQMVLRGGACITPASHVRATYRNFFPPGSRWLFGGVRLAADA